MLLELPPEILSAIAGLDPHVCRRLWKYLPEPRRIRPGLDWARPFVTTTVYYNVTKTTLFGVLHSVDDLPAITTKWATAWYNRGVLHRIGGPAITFKNIDWVWDMRSGENKVQGIQWSFSDEGLRTGDPYPASFWFQNGELARDGMTILAIDIEFMQFPGMAVLCVDVVNSRVEITFDEIYINDTGRYMNDHYFVYD